MTVKKLTFSSTVFLIFTLASTTVFPALFTALYKNPPRLFAPASAFVETVGRNEKSKMKMNVTFVRVSCSFRSLTAGAPLKQGRSRRVKINGAQDCRGYFSSRQKISRLCSLRIANWKKENSVVQFNGWLLLRRLFRNAKIRDCYLILIIQRKDFRFMEKRILVIRSSHQLKGRRSSMLLNQCANIFRRWLLFQPRYVR